MKRLGIVLLAFCLGLAASAQAVSLTVTKSGSDVVLTWTGGTPPYSVVKSHSPTMSIRSQLVATTSGTTATDTGGASVSPPLVYYRVSDSTAPTVTVTSVQPGFSVIHPFICASGTATSPASTIVAVYANALLAAGTTIWTTCDGTHFGAPLAVPSDPVIGIGRLFLQVAAKDANDNWGFSWLFGSFGGVLGSRDKVRPRGVGR